MSREVRTPVADEEDVMVYSSRHSHRTAHPRWDHVDQHLSLLDPDNAYARFVVIDDGKESVLAEISLRPSQLRRLPTADASDGKGGMAMPPAAGPEGNNFNCGERHGHDKEDRQRGVQGRK